jgi:CheY-like chemotaxis protein
VSTPYILVVDNFPDGRDMLAEYLTFRGFEVETADDGLEAVARTIARRCHICRLELAVNATTGKLDVAPLEPAKDDVPRA